MATCWRRKTLKLKIQVFKKISWKLTLIYAVIFSVVLVALNAGILFGLRYYLIKQAKSQVENSALSTMKLIFSQEGQEILKNSNILSKVQPMEEMNIKLEDAHGKIISSTSRNGLDTIGITSTPGTTAVVETNDMHLVVRNDPIKQGVSTIAYLQVVYDMRKEYFFIKALFVLMALADAIGVVLSVFTGILISKRILRPIDQITKTAKSISVSDLNSKIEVNETDDELARLAVTFNEMIARLKNSFEKQSRFVSDASHELRTPISIIRGYTDVVDRWGKNDAAVFEESIGVIKRETDNMSVLIERLLFLAKGETGSIRLQAENFDAEVLITEVVNESQLIAPDRLIQYSADKPSGINADRKLIKQMLRAIIDNSIKFTGPGGRINIKFYRQDAKFAFEVADDGVGIPKEELSRIFDRFYVVDKSRSKEKGGSGLGLSIVKWIVESHNGSVSVRSPETGGTVVAAEFPDNP